MSLGNKMKRIEFKNELDEQVINAQSKKRVTMGE